MSSHHHTITLSQSHYSSSFILIALSVSLPSWFCFPFNTLFLPHSCT